MRTTKIVVEEASSPSDAGDTFTFVASQSSRKSEISVEEVASYSLNAPRLESEVSDNMVIENVDSGSDIHLQTSRQMSIVSVESSKNEEEEDDQMEDLLSRIKKQRSDLENILGIERKESEEKAAKKAAKKQDKQAAAVVKDECAATEGIFHPINKNTFQLIYSTLL